jgi:hypothetical protein
MESRNFITVLIYLRHKLVDSPHCSLFVCKGPGLSVNCIIYSIIEHYSITDTFLVQYEMNSKRTWVKEEWRLLGCYAVWLF